jgi:CBS domain-containing protein
MRANDPVNRLMSDPVLTIGPDQSMADALRLFMSHAVHHLPVVEQDRVVGMLSSADVMKLPCALQATTLTHAAWNEARWRVKEYMQSPVITVAARETIQRAAELMAVNGIHCLPVVDGNALLTGIITTTDIMRDCIEPPAEVSLADPDLAKSFPLSDVRVAAALAAARKALNTGHDPNAVAATLLLMHQRASSLELVAKAAKRYLNAGQDESLHAKLRTAIERADRLDERTRYPAISNPTIGA